MHVCRPPVPLAAHFRGKSAHVRELYRTVRAALRAVGPVHVDSTKTRIAFALETIFLELTPQVHALRGCLVLPQPARHPTFRRVISLSPRIHYHYFILSAAKQIDRRFRRLLAEGFLVGRREHLKGPGRSQQIVPSPMTPATRERRAFVSTTRALWRCPRCGNYFVNRNLWHSCVRVPLARHFKGKASLVRRTFDALLTALRRNGPVRVVSSKTRITFMVRIRFAGVQPGKNCLRGTLILSRRAYHPRIFRYQYFLPHYHLHHFSLIDSRQLDSRFRRLLADAYRVGQQEHVRRKNSPR